MGHDTLLEARDLSHVRFTILLECSFVYLFMAPETWLPAPKAPGKKGCSQTEV